MRQLTAYIIGLVFAVGLVAQAHAADIRLVSTSFETGKTWATSYNDNFKSSDSIDHAENMGFGAEMKFAVGQSGLRLNLGFSYQPLKVSEFGPPELALSRTGYPYWTNFWSQTQGYVNAVKSDGTTPLYSIAYDYVYHMNYLNLNIGIDYAPQMGDRIKPFIAVGIAPSKFDQRGYWVTDVAAEFEDANGVSVGRYAYKVRAHTATRNKHRGYVFNVWGAGGVDLMITKNLGIQAKIRYFKTFKDNDRNRITGYYNINAGIVFHNM